MGQKEEGKLCDSSVTNGEEYCSTVNNQKLDTLHSPNDSFNKEANLLLCRVCHCAESDIQGDAALGFLNILPPSHEMANINKGCDSTDKVPTKDVDKDVVHAKNHKESGTIEFISPEGEIFVCSADIESGPYHQQDALIDLGCSCKNELALAHYACALKWFISHGSTKCEICGNVAKYVRLADYNKVMAALKEYEALKERTATGELAQVHRETSSDVDPDALAAVRRQRLSEVSLWFNPHYNTFTVSHETVEQISNIAAEDVVIVENPTAKWAVEGTGILVATGLLTVTLAWLIAPHVGKVTSRKDQHQYWARTDESYSYVPVNEFSEAFQFFHVGQSLQRDLRTPFDKSKDHPAALATSKYGIGKMELLKACLSREYLLMKRNSFVYISRIVQLTVLAFIVMTVFLRTTMHHDTVEDGLVYMGALYVGLITHLFNGFSELAMSIVRLPIFYKQRDLLFYPAWAYALPAWVLKIPISLIECAVWTIMTYYTVGFDPNAQRMFRQYLLIVVVSQMAGGLFRLVAALGRDMVTSFTFGAFAELILIALGGFILSRNDIKEWWIWGYWSSPLMYATNAIAVNEFLTRRWGYDVNTTLVTDAIGIQVLKSRGLATEPNWYWIGVVALIGYIFLFNGLNSLALEYLKPIGKGQTVVSEETLKEKDANRTGEYLKPFSVEKSTGNDIVRSEISVSDANQSNRKGMILPFTPLCITFEDIKYSVDMPMEMKAQGITEDRLLLLNGLNGAFRPGVLTALMGVSGAGKTTLMDVLAGRKTGGHIEGDIRISGYPKKQETFARISGYCEQNDIHSPHVTVYESLIYSAWLRLAPGVDSTTKSLFVEEVMELVELTSQREAIVGLPGVSGLSTEQRKRLTIAVELVANPSIIFMDEPTSGLDARAAAIVMRTVRNTVDTGRTVVCTIHQPSIDIFEAFDELFLMKRGGEEIYVGPLGRNSCHLINYFEGINGVRKITDAYNPATWMLEVSSSAQEEILGINFSNTYKNSELFRRNKALVNELSASSPGSKELYFPTQYPQPFLTQWKACLWKQHKSYWRNPEYSATRIFFTFITALMIGTMFWRLGSKMDTLPDLMNAMGSMYNAVLFVGIQNSQMVQPVVDVERTVFYREKAAGMYSALPYAFAQVIIEVPYILVQTMIYGVIVYTLMDFSWTGAKFFWYLFFSFTSFLYFTLYGMMAVSLTPNSDIAAIVSSAFYGIWNVFTGFITPRPRIAIWWRWYYWLNPVAWTLYGLFVSQFGDVKDVMNTGESVEAILHRHFGYSRDFLGATVVAVLGFSFLFAFVFAFGIRTLNFQKR